MIKRSLEEVSGYNLYSKNAIPNNKTVNLNKNAKIHFIISLELQWLQKYKYATAGHVNPKKPAIGKIGTMYPPNLCYGVAFGGIRPILSYNKLKP